MIGWECVVEDFAVGSSITSLGDKVEGVGEVLGVRWMGQFWGP